MGPAPWSCNERRERTSVWDLSTRALLSVSKTLAPTLAFSSSRTTSPNCLPTPASRHSLDTSNQHFQQWLYLLLTDFYLFWLTLIKSISPCFPVSHQLLSALPLRPLKSLHFPSIHCHCSGLGYHLLQAAQLKTLTYQTSLLLLVLLSTVSFWPCSQWEQNLSLQLFSLQNKAGSS